MPATSDMFTRQAWRSDPRTSHTQMNIAALLPCDAFSASVACLYAHPVSRQRADIAEVQQAESWMLPEDMNYRRVLALRTVIPLHLSSRERRPPALTARRVQCAVGAER